MKLITRPGNPMGAGIEDILDALGLPEGTGNYIAIQHLAGLHKQLSRMGLMIKHNPIANVFYLDTTEDIKLQEEETHLPDRLAATLLVVITLTYQEGEWVPFGTGTVSADGTTIESDAGSGLPCLTWFGYAP